jgi:cytochrome c-type biogenesis protein CcmF
MLATTGYYCLIAAFAFSIFALANSILGARLRRADLVESGERGVVAVFFFILFASGILLHALITRNFEFEYVSHYTSTTLPTRYAMAAFWGGQAGSMLFWVLILQLYTIVALLQNQNKNRQLMPYVTSV